MTTATTSARPEGLIGRSVPNLDGIALVTGKARFTCDLVLPGMVYGRLVHSTVAHGRILRVDATAALAVAGVLTVITPEDTADLPLVTSGPFADMPLLARGKTRYVGEPVAAVVATTQEVADRAAELVQVDYDELPATFDPEEARRPGAPVVHENVPGIEVDGNVGFRRNTKVGDIDAAFEHADLVVEQRFRTSRAHAMPMETHGALASWDDVDQSLTVWSSTQHPHLLRTSIAYVFGVPESRIRVVKPFVGGAFGHKVGLKAHEAVAILASRRLGRPVRVLLSRREEFTATVTRTPHIRDVSIAVSRDGVVLGWREKIILDMGAYSGLAPSILCLSEWVTVGPYRTPALDIEGECVYTNLPRQAPIGGSAIRRRRLLES